MRFTIAVSAALATIAIAGVIFAIINRSVLDPIEDLMTATRRVRAGLYRDVWQTFCVLLDIRTVDVQDDERTYCNVIVIRAVTSDDAMTAD